MLYSLSWMVSSVDTVERLGVYSLAAGAMDHLFRFHGGSVTTGGPASAAWGPLAARGPAEAKGLIQAEWRGPRTALGSSTRRLARPARLTLRVGEDAVHLDREHQAKRKPFSATMKRKRSEACRRTGSAGPTRGRARRARRAGTESRSSTQRAQRRVSVKSTKNLRLSSPTQLLTHGQWWCPADAALAHSAGSARRPARRRRAAAARQAGCWRGARGQGAGVGEHGPRVGGQGQGGQQVEERAVHRAVGRLLRREQPGAQQQRALAQRQRPRGRGAHDAQGVGHEPHARRCGRAPRGQAGWLPECLRLRPSPSRALPGSAWDSPSFPPQSSERAPPVGACEHRKAPPPSPGKAPFPAVTVLVWGEWGQRALDLGGGGGAGCGRGPFKVLLLRKRARGGNAQLPPVCACGAHMCVSGRHFSVHSASSLILTTLTAQRFTSQFADARN